MRLILVIALSVLSLSAHGDFPDLFNTEPISDASLMPAEEAAASMKLPDGFVAKAFAAEPDVQNPIASAWDRRGRLWVAENYTYAERSQKFQLDLRDRVIILDGADSDRMTKRTVFTDDVQMLTSIEVGMGGVWLMCPPQLLFIPDADEDDVPDGPAQTVLDGFTVAEANYHNFANGLRFGPDGWLYGRCGGSCPGRIGIPGTPDKNRLAMEGGVWRYHPKRKTVEVLNAGTTNPWGHDWNALGEMFFVNTVNGHLWHMIPGSHLTRPFLLDPNPHTYELIDFHADHWHFDTKGRWTDSRGGAANDFGGGHAHSGTMIYQGDAWPAKYRDRLFTLNFHGRRANTEILRRDGSGYVASHGDDFFIAADKWFRGMDLSSGPDGNVFVLDWSDEGECHEHTGVHRTSGRVFKIRPQSFATQNRVPQWNEIGISQSLFSDNVWHRNQARLAYWQNPEPTVTRLLRRRLESATKPANVLQALWCLHVADELPNERLLALLNHHHESVRAWAIRLATDHYPIDDTLGAGWKASLEIEVDEDLIARLIRMAKNDSSGLVRLTLASTMQRLPAKVRVDLAANLVRSDVDAGDHNLPLMVWYGLIPVAKQSPEQLLEVAKNCKLPKTLKLIARYASEKIVEYPDVINELIAMIAESSVVEQQSVLQGMQEGLKGWQRAPRPEAWGQLTSRADPQVESIVRDLSVLFGDGRAMEDLIDIALGKTQTADPIRLAALEKLIQIDPPQLREVCEALLGNNRFNVTAARGLSQFDDPEIGRAIVKRYRNFRAPFRPQVISILVSRPSFAQALLEAIRDGKIQRNDLTAFGARQILSMNDKKLAGLLREVWGDVRESSAEKLKTIASLKSKLIPEKLGAADRSRGRALFVKTCQTCHRLYGQGGKVGPDLTGSNRNNLDYLLGNIVDPSGVVDKDYRMTLLLLDDGRVINGLVTAEAEKTLSIQTATEALVLPKDKIETRKLTDKSSMPEGLLETLDDEQIADLIGYLSHSTQVDLP